MLAPDWLGGIAGTLTTIAFVPQVLRIHQRRTAADISWSMFGIFSLGVGLWLLYGWQMGALPIILANSVTLVLALWVLALKWRFSRDSRHSEEVDR